MGYKSKITHINFDLDGEIEWGGFNKNHEYYPYELSATSDGRETVTLHVGINYRIPKDYQDWRFKLKKGTKLYGYEVSFDAIRKLDANFV